MSFCKRYFCKFLLVGGWWFLVCHSLGTYFLLHFFLDLQLHTALLIFLEKKSFCRGHMERVVCTRMVQLVPGSYCLLNKSFRTIFATGKVEKSLPCFESSSTSLPSYTIKLIRSLLLYGHRISNSTILYSAAFLLHCVSTSYTFSPSHDVALCRQ